MNSFKKDSMRAFSLLSALICCASVDLAAQDGLGESIQAVAVAVAAVRSHLPEGKVVFDNRLVPFSPSEKVTTKRLDEAGSRVAARNLSARIADFNDVRKCDSVGRICHFDDAKIVLATSAPRQVGGLTEVLVRAYVEIAPNTKRPFKMEEYVVRLQREGLKWIVKDRTLVASS